MILDGTWQGDYRSMNNNLACQGDYLEERRKDCELEFDRIWTRFGQGNLKFEKLTDKDEAQNIEINIIKTNVIHLVGSMNSLTKSIWGMTSAIILMLAGFFIWYIQNK